MKYFLIIIFITSLCYSQENKKNNFEEKYNELIEHLTKENWSKSEKLTKELLEYTEAIDSMQNESKVLRYIYIYSTAGLLNEKKLSKDKALKKIKFLQSKELIMPTHPFKSNCYVNCTHLMEDEKDTFMTGVNNAAGTQLFSFEYVKIKKGIKETQNELEGKYVTLKGELNEISVEGNMLPRFKLKFINGDYLVAD